MDTIMHIAYTSKPCRRTMASMAPAVDNIRLLYTVDRTELHLLNGITRRLKIIHSASHMDQFLDAQKRVSDAVKVYEARIYKMVPPNDIA